jgi:hypothetical protein
MGRITFFAFSETGEVMLGTDALTQIAADATYRLARLPEGHRQSRSHNSCKTGVTANILTIFPAFHFDDYGSLLPESGAFRLFWVALYCIALTHFHP